MAQPNPTSAAPPWWETTPWWQLKPQVANPSTWPIVAPVVGTLGGVNGGPNWVPGLSPILRGPANLNNAVAQGAAGALENTLTGFVRNPRQPAPAAPSGPPAPAWDFGGQNVGGIVRAESGGNPNAKNPRSSASGLGQFIDSTWMDKDLRKRAGFDKMDDATWKRLKTGEAGAAAQMAMTQAYAQRNSEQWEGRFQRAPDPGQLYGMHFLDAQPFMYLTEMAAASPGVDGTKLFPQAARSNPEIFYHDPKTRKQPRTAGELYAEITRRGQPSDPWTMPALQGMDPRAMAGMIPNPSRPQHINLPNAPQMGLAPPRPAEEQANIPEALALLQQFAPKPFDEAEANRGRLPAILGGIAQGAAQADSGWGSILAAMGAGASAVGTRWDEGVKAERRGAEEAQRLFNLSLAKLNLNMQEGNRGVRNRNADRKWQDSRDKVATEFNNASAQWETDVKEYLTNNGLDNQFLRDLDGARMTRARIALGAIEQNVDLQNQQATGQHALDLKRYLFEDERSTRGITDQQSRVVENMLTGIGVDLKLAGALKDAPSLNAAQAAHYMASNNKQAAINSLGREIALTGRFDLLPEGELKKQIEMLAKKDPTVAGEAIGRVLNEGEAADPGSALTWAKLMAANGYPVGQLFLRHVKQAQSPANGASTPAAK